MASVVILYTPPDQVEAFERRYHAEYLPSIQAIPSVSRLSSLRIASGPYGDPPYYRMETWHLAEDADPKSVFRTSVWFSAPETVNFALGLATPMFAEDTCNER